MKQKFFIIATILLLLTVCLAGCSNDRNYEGMTKIVFELEGGIYQNSGLPITHYYRFEEGSENTIADPATLSKESVSRTGYRLEGWYTTKSQNGDETVYSGKWDFSSDKVTTSGVILYAKWSKDISLTYNVCYTDEATGQKVVLGTYNVVAGDKFSDYMGYARLRAGYTALGVFEDENGNEWNADFTHPGGDSDLAIDVYATYVKGIFTIVRTADELKRAKSANIYLMNDIDMGGAELSFADYRKIFEGNGHTVSNFKIAYSSSRYDLVEDFEDENNKSLCISLFGNAENATIRNVDFKDVSVEINTTLSTIYRIYLAPISVSVKGTTIENVTVDMSYSIVRLPNQVEADMYDRLVVFTEACGIVDETSSVVNASVNLVKV